MLPLTGRTDRLREFGWALGTAFAMAAGLFAWLGARRTGAILAIAGGVLLAVATLLPKVLRPLETLWRASGRTVERLEAWCVSRMLRLARLAQSLAPPTLAAPRASERVGAAGERLGGAGAARNGAGEGQPSNSGTSDPAGPPA